MKILVTGCAGFIGYHLIKRLISEGHDIVGIDNLNNYYDVKLKQDRLNQLNIEFIKHDLVLPIDINYKFDKVIHLAAQAGVRYSIDNPQAYIDSNITGFLNILEFCRKTKTDLIFASSSSVYGHNERKPSSEIEKTDKPASLYGATKKANELMAYAYSSLYDFNIIGLRFFTVYGSWGRPDMALFKFTKNILEGKPIELYNNGDMKRDFTHVSDVVEAITKLLDKKLNYKIYNIGHGYPCSLVDYITMIEKKLKKKAILKFMPMQLGDVQESFADITELKNDINYQPKVNRWDGISEFIDWYISYYGEKNGL